MSHRYAQSGGAQGADITAEASPITITGGAANTKGAWADLVATTSRDVMGLGLFVTEAIFIANTDTSILMDIGIGNTGDAIDDILVPDVTVGYQQIFATIFFPIFVRKGERIAARIQGTQASETFVSRPWVEYAPPPPHWAGFHAGDQLTPMTNSAPTMGNFTNNAFEEIIASTINPYRAFSFYPAIVTNSASNADHLIELGVGGSGSEQVIGRWAVETGANENFASYPMVRYVCARVPAGSRLAVRKTGTTAVTGSFIGWR